MTTTAMKGKLSALSADTAQHFCDTVHQQQLGVRRYASELGRWLAEYIQTMIGRPHIVLQANSGAEALELALKLAEFGQRARIELLKKYRQRAISSCEVLPT